MEKRWKDKGREREREGLRERESKLMINWSEKKRKERKKLNWKQNKE